MSKQKRPVYVVQKDLGIVNDERVIVLIGIKLTNAGAEQLKAGNPGSEIVRKNLVD